MIKLIKNIANTKVLKLSLLMLVAIVYSCSDTEDDTTQQIVESIPIAAYSSTVDINDWKTYAFTNLSSNATNYVWDFGDENSSAEAEPTHTYAAAGSYEVALTAKDNLGEEDTVIRTIVVSNPNAAQALFTVTADATDWQTYTFTNQSTNATSYTWDYGDGNTSTETEETHTYASAGTYTITLTATGTAGDPSTAEQTIELVDPNAGVDATFAAVLLNGTIDELNEKNDNADAWDMTPSSTIVDNNGDTVDSPYKAIWNNSTLNDWLEANISSSNEVGGISTTNNSGSYSMKLHEIQRRMYQPMTVEVGVEYTIKLWVKAEQVGELSVYIMDNEITDETTLETDNLNKFVVTGGVNNTNSFQEYQFTFVATTTTALFYAKRTGTVIDGDNEVYLDDISIETPGF